MAMHRDHLRIEICDCVFYDECLFRTLLCRLKHRSTEGFTASGKPRIVMLEPFAYVTFKSRFSLTGTSQLQKICSYRTNVHLGFSLPIPLASRQRIHHLCNALRTGFVALGIGDPAQPVLAIMRGDGIEKLYCGGTLQ